MEEGAASLGAGRLTIFRRIILPNLLPAILVRHRAGLRPGHQRVRLHGAHLRQHAVQDPGRRGADLRPDRERQPGAARRRCRPSCSSSRSSSSSLLDVIQRWAAVVASSRRWASPGVRTKAAARPGVRSLQRAGAASSLSYLLFLLLVPVGLVFKRTFEHGVRPVWDALTTASARPRLPGHARGRRHRGHLQHDVRGGRRAAARAAPLLRASGCSTPSSTCRSPSRRSWSAWR